MILGGGPGAFRNNLNIGDWEKDCQGGAHRSFSEELQQAAARLFSDKKGAGPWADAFRAIDAVFQNGRSIVSIVDGDITQIAEAGASAKIGVPKLELGNEKKNSLAASPAYRPQSPATDY